HSLLTLAALPAISEILFPRLKLARLPPLLAASRAALPSISEIPFLDSWVPDLKLRPCPPSVTATSRLYLLSRSSHSLHSLDISAFNSVRYQQSESTIVNS